MGRELTHLSLFSGIGGLDLAAEWAGFRTVGQCEWADYPRAVLEKHWPGLPRWRDIRTLTKESFFEQTGLRTVDVISGGFPCQPFSFAGKRRGKDDDRYLWPEMLRVIRELQPTWVIGENVPGIVNLALDEVLASLEAEGYEVQCFLVPACGVDAPHRRERCVIVAYSNKKRQNEQFLTSVTVEKTQSCGTSDKERTFPDSYHQRFQKSGQKSKLKEIFKKNRTEFESGGESQPRVGGMDDGFSCWLDEPEGVPRVNGTVKYRVARIQCLGNAVVPQQFYPFFAAIAEIERSDYE